MCRASAEQLSCLGSIVIGDACVEGGDSSGGVSGSETWRVELSLALAPSMESVRSELARGRSCIVRVRGTGEGTASSMITQVGGDSGGTEGCAGSVEF
jgi:hypothetical protein